MLESNARNGDESLVIEPTPVYVIEVNAQENKVFINICSSKMVDSSGPTFSQMFRVPMSIGPVFRDVDKRGRIFDVIDIVVSPDIVRESLADSGIRDNFHALLLDSIEKKHSIKLRSDWKMIKEQYKGEKVRQHCIRNHRTNLIEEIAGPLHEPKGREDSFSDVVFTMIYKNPELTSSVDLLDVAGSDENEDEFKEGFTREFSVNGANHSCKKNLDEVLSNMSICELSLLNINNPRSYKIRVSSHRLHVTRSGMNRKEFDIWFPKIMDNTCVSAQYDKEGRKILLSIKSKDA